MQVCYRNVFGQKKIYPLNEPARIIAELARGGGERRLADGRIAVKTLTERDLELAEKLGLDVTVLPDPDMLAR
jgi:hypothetical protein